MFFRVQKPFHSEISRKDCEYSFIRLAEDAGFLFLRPSDLVYEASSCRVDYYDYIISVKLRELNQSYQLFLAKLNKQTNVESYESFEISRKLSNYFGLPNNEIILLIIAAHEWKDKITDCKVLCLVNRFSDNQERLSGLLKKLMVNLKCRYHVVCDEQRRSIECMLQTNCVENFVTANDMRSRITMCKHHRELQTPPFQAIHETCSLLAPNSSFLCGPFLWLL